MTAVIFHDFTVYSAALDLYANVRLTTEFEGNGGFINTQVNLRVFWLERPMWFMLVQWGFGAFLALLVLGELMEVAEGWQAAEMVLVETIVESKYKLRLKKLQFAAQYGVPSMYQPIKVLRKLTIRLFQVDPSCVHHIKVLNAFGNAVPKLQDHYEDTMRMLKASGASASKDHIYKENPIVANKLDTTLAWLHTLQNDDGQRRTCVTLQQWRIRLSASLSYYFQNEWNGLDAVSSSHPPPQGHCIALG